MAVMKILIDGHEFHAKIRGPATTQEQLEKWANNFAPCSSSVRESDMTLPNCTPPATRGIVSLRDVVEAIVRDDPLPNCCPPIDAGGPMQFVRRPSIREFAAERGIDLSKVRERPDVFDVITGQRVSPEEGEET